MRLKGQMSLHNLREFRIRKHCQQYHTPVIQGWEVHETTLPYRDLRE